MKNSEGVRYGKLSVERSEGIKEGMIGKKLRMLRRKIKKKQKGWKRKDTQPLISRVLLGPLPVSSFVEKF